MAVFYFDLWESLIKADKGHKVPKNSLMTETE